MNQINDIAEHQQAMTRHRRRVAHARTPKQQWEISQRLQTAAMEAILKDPDAYRAFLKRNYRTRRVDRADQLAIEMMRRER
jgi:hypothetical protein